MWNFNEYVLSVWTESIIPYFNDTSFIVSTKKEIGQNIIIVLSKISLLVTLINDLRWKMVHIGSYDAQITEYVRYEGQSY
jgi:hypothetical protein